MVALARPVAYTPSSAAMISSYADEIERIASVLDAISTTITKTQTADQTSPNTTDVLSTSLIVPLDANSTYALDSIIFYDTNATADFYCRLYLPSGATHLISWWGQATGNAAVDSPLVHSAVYSTGTAAFNAGGVASGTIMSLRPAGTIWTTTAGFVTVAFSQATANASNTILKRGSRVALTKTA